MTRGGASGLVQGTGRVLDRPEIWRPTAWIAAAGLVGLALLIALAPGDRALRTINAWTVFHYTLSTKYFVELGYFDLYNAARLFGLELGYYALLLLFEAPVRQRFFFFNLGLAVYFVWLLAVFLRRDLRWLRTRNSVR